MDVATVESLLVAVSFARLLAGLAASAAHVPPSTWLAPELGASFPAIVELQASAACIPSSPETPLVRLAFC